jgi:hypothetical protein
MKMNVNNTEVNTIQKDGSEFISLTDIARFRNQNEPFSVINNWLRSRNTIEFVGLWELLNNESFKPIEFERFRNEAGSNYFVLSPQRWILATNAIGIISKSGRYGGTFAHEDIAMEFASWISPEYKLYLIREFKRLKKAENSLNQLEWNVRRALSKINYRIQTDAILDNLIPVQLDSKQMSVVFASEADLLNVALFGMTAADWRKSNRAVEGNIRDYASLEQLVVLSNLESINALLIHQGHNQSDRLIQLNEVAIMQMKSLVQQRLENKIRLTK